MAEGLEIVQVPTSTYELKQMLLVRVLLEIDELLFTDEKLADESRDSSALLGNKEKETPPKLEAA